MTQPSLAFSSIRVLADDDEIRLRLLYALLLQFAIKIFEKTIQEFLERFSKKKSRKFLKIIFLKCFRQFSEKFENELLEIRLFSKNFNKSKKINFFPKKESKIQKVSLQISEKQENYQKL